MKHAKRILWLSIAIIATIGFVLIGCKEPDDNVTQTHTHQWGNWSVTTAATCVATGSQTRACSSCDETQTEAIGIDTVNGHDMQVVEGEEELAPTCEEDGLGEMACAREGFVIRPNV